MEIFKRESTNNLKAAIEKNDADIQNISASQFPEGYVQSVVASEVTSYVEKNSGGFVTTDKFDSVAKKYYYPTWISGKYINLNGEEALLSDSACTDFISCKYLKHLYIDASMHTSGYLIAFYDENKNIISDYSVPGASNTQRIKISMDLIAMDVAYVRLSRYGSGSLCYLFNEATKLEKDIEKYINNNGERYFYPNFHIDTNGKFKYNNGSKYTDYIDCQYIKSFKLQSYMSDAGYQVAFYDDCYQIIPEISILGTGVNRIIEMDVPEAAYYMICTHYGSTPYSLTVNSYFNHTFAKKEDIHPLKGKKVMFFGDSITYMDRCYRKPLLENTGMIQIENFAVAGAWMTTYEGSVLDGNPTTEANNTVPNQVQKMLSGSYDVPDIVIISAGTNGSFNPHWAYGYEESQFTSSGAYIDVDTCDLTHVSGAMRWMYEKIKSVYTDTIIFFATPIQAAEDLRTYENISDRAKKITEIANRLGAGVIDACTQSGIYGRYETAYANGKYLQDGLHPSEEGGKQLAKCYQKELEKNILV